MRVNQRGEVFIVLVVNTMIDGTSGTVTHEQFIDERKTRKNCC